MQKAETRIVKNILMRLKQDWSGDGFHVHGSAMQRNGEPDIDASIYSERLDQWLHLKIEVKTNEGTPTKLQIVRLRRYHKRGYVAALVTNYEELLKWIHVYEAYFKTLSPIHISLIPKSFMNLANGMTDPYGVYADENND